MMQSTLNATFHFSASMWNAHHVLSLGRDKDSDFLAFHAGSPGLTGEKGSKGDYGSQGPKGQPGLKGAKGDRGLFGKAVCHGVCGADRAFGFGTVHHRLAQAALGHVYRAHLEELNRQISLPRRWMCRVSHLHLVRCAKRHASKQMHYIFSNPWSPRKLV